MPSLISQHSPPIKEDFAHWWKALSSLRCSPLLIRQFIATSSNQNDDSGSLVGGWVMDPWELKITTDPSGGDSPMIKSIEVLRTIKRKRVIRVSVQNISLLSPCFPPLIGDCLSSGFDNHLIYFDLELGC